MGPQDDADLVSMGVLDLWMHALGNFKLKHHQDLSEFAGKKIVFDGRVVLNKCNNREVTQLVTTNDI